MTVPPRAFQTVADADFSRLAAEIPTGILRGQTLLLTGATGFFGGWLLALLDWQWRMDGRGARVFAVSRDPSAFLLRHPRLRGAPWLHWIEGDIRGFPFPDVRIDGVMHAATDTSAVAGKAPGLLLDTIVGGTRRVLACARRQHAGRILLVGSGAVYGAQAAERFDFDEAVQPVASPLDPFDAYAEGKRMMEAMGVRHAEETGMAVVSARGFAFVGAGLPLDAHFAIGNFIRDALWRDRIVVRGGGRAVRSYLYAADLAVWLFRLLLSGESRNAYNVASDAGLTIADLARCVATALAPGLPVSIEGADDPATGRKSYVPAIAKARALDLDVWTPLADAIVSTAAVARFSQDGSGMVSEPLGRGVSMRPC